MAANGPTALATSLAPCAKLTAAAEMTWRYLKTWGLRAPGGVQGASFESRRGLGGAGMAGETQAVPHARHRRSLVKPHTRCARRGSNACGLGARLLHAGVKLLSRGVDVVQAVVLADAGWGGERGAARASVMQAGSCTGSRALGVSTREKQGGMASQRRDNQRKGGAPNTSALRPPVRRLRPRVTHALRLLSCEGEERGPR
jgi:hypothetical protein